MTYPTRKNLIATISPTPYAKPLLIDLSTPAPHRFFINVAVSGVYLVGTGGAGAPYSYTITSGALPTGLSLNGSTGQITGTPTVQGSAAFVAKVTDGASNTFQHGLAINVEAALQGLAGGTTPTTGTVNTPYNYQFLVADFTGSTAGVTYSLLSGSLPTGLSLSAGGLISGTPTANGTSNFTVRATKTGDGNLDIPCALVITRRLTSLVGFSVPVALTRMTVGTPVSGTISIGVAGRQYGLGKLVWSVSSGALPSGLTMDSDGNVTGTPDTVTTSSYSQPTITVTDPRTGVATSFTPAGTQAFNVAPTISAATAINGSFTIVNADGSTDQVDYLAGLCGTGSDGDIVIDGTTDPPSCPRVGGVNVAIRDIHAHDISCVAGGRLEMAGFDLYWTGNLDISAAPANAITSRNQTPSFLTKTAGVFGSDGGIGGLGSTTNGAVGGSVTTGFTFTNGGYGGTGGATVGKGGHGTGTNVGGDGGVSSAVTRSRPQALYDMGVRIRPLTVDVIGAGLGGAAGGGGAGNGSAAGTDGGDGGGGGGRLTMRGRKITRSGSTAAGAINVSASDGKDSANAPATGRASGGGGCGGGGGGLRLYYGELAGTTATDCLYADGGDGGDAGTIVGGLAVTRGIGGYGGDGGTILSADMLHGSATLTVGSSGSAPSTFTGGAKGTCRVSL